MGSVWGLISHVKAAVVCKSKLWFNLNQDSVTFSDLLSTGTNLFLKNLKFDLHTAVTVPLWPGITVTTRWRNLIDFFLQKIWALPRFGRQFGKSMIVCECSEWSTDMHPASSLPAANLGSKSYNFPHFSWFSLPYLLLCLTVLITPVKVLSLVHVMRVLKV